VLKAIISNLQNDQKSYNIFYRCSGNEKNPAIVLGHGWPTSSYDYLKLSFELESSYYVCTVDYLGYRFSDKPSNYKYDIFENADVIEQLVTKVKPLKSFAYLTHDQGDSVGFIFI